MTPPQMVQSFSKSKEMIMVDIPHPPPYLPFFSSIREEKKGPISLAFELVQRWKICKPLNYMSLATPSLTTTSFKTKIMFESTVPSLQWPYHYNYSIPITVFKELLDTQSWPVPVLYIYSYGPNRGVSKLAGIFLVVFG